MVLLQVSEQQDVSSFSCTSSDWFSRVLSVKMSVSQLASSASLPLRTTLSKHVSLWVSSVQSWNHYPQDTVCLLCTCISWVTSSPSLSVFGSNWGHGLRSSARQTGLVPTAPHFHKQMSDNLMTLSTPLPPCAHTYSYCSSKMSPLCAFIQRALMWFHKLNIYILRSILNGF